MLYTYRYLYIGLLSLLLYSCESEREAKKQQISNEGPSATDSLLEHAQHAEGYSEWAELHDVDIVAVSTDSFVQENIEKAQFHIRATDAREYDRPGYRDLYVYNKDSSKNIDIFSYSYIIDSNQTGALLARRGEADQEVAVVDRKNNKRIRVLFCGPGSCEVEKAFWYNDTIVGLLGVESQHETYKPTIWFVNIANGQTITYTYNRQINADPSAHVKEIMKEKGIKLID